MSSTVQEIPAAVLEALALPELDGLTDDQVRGADCLWCAATLTIETAVDLGEHMSPRWFPRSCRSCLGRQAYRALFEHAAGCGQCVAVPGGCDLGLRLYRLVREGRR